MVEEVLTKRLKNVVSMKAQFLEEKNNGFALGCGEVIEIAAGFFALVLLDGFLVESSLEPSVFEHFTG